MTAARSVMTPTSPPLTDLDDTVSSAGCSRARSGSVATSAFESSLLAGRPDQPQLPRDQRERSRRWSSGCPLRSRRCSRSTATPSAPTPLPRHRPGSHPASWRTPRTSSALVIEWIDGHTFGAADLDDSATLATVAADLPAAARRPAVRHRVRHVRRPAALPRPGAWRGVSGCRRRYLDFMPLVAYDARRAGGARRGHGAVSQRPARRQHHGERRTRCGSSTTSTPATATRASSSATSAASPTSAPTG